jgi:shikimate kinase
MIVARLSQELTRHVGTLRDVGEWMGFPYEPQYKQRESKYLLCEIEEVGKILDYLSENNSQKNIVVDTTGSVIYTGEEVLARLRSNTTVVHLTTPAEIQEQMLKSYIARPRPVVWRDLFYKGPGESNEEALARCYLRLLLFRERLYAEQAHVKIDYYTRNREGFGIEDLLKEIQAQVIRQ